MALSGEDLALAARARILADPSNTIITPKVIDTPGTDIYLFLRGLGAVGEELVRLFEQDRQSRFVSTAGLVSDEALDRAVAELTNNEVRRQSDVAAVSEVIFSRSNTYALQLVPETTPIGASTGVTFRPITDVVWSEGDASPKAVKVKCETSGSVGNVDAGSISTLPGGLGDTTLSCTNPEPASKGLDRESNDRLLARALDWYKASRRATKSALEFGAKSVGGVTQVTAIELKEPDIDIFYPKFRVQLVFGDEFGQGNQAVAAEITEALEEYRAAGVPVQTIPASRQYVTIKWKGLKAAQGYSLAALKSALAKQHQATVNLALGPKLTLYLNALQADANKITGLIVPAGSLIAPSTDVPPGEGKKLWVRLQDIVFED